MFFARLALFALPAIAIAGGVNSCTQGSAQYCCNTVQNANALSAGQKGLASFFGFNTDNVIGQFGFDCNPITGAGAIAGGAAAFGASGCNQQSVCCQDSAANGFLAANCNPIIGNA